MDPDEYPDFDESLDEEALYDEDYFVPDTTIGTWCDKGGKAWKIKEMETSHIINCMKMLEKMMFASMKHVLISERRKAVGAALGTTSKYRELEAELMARIKRGTVRLSDFFMAVKCKKPIKLRLF